MNRNDLLWLAGYLEGEGSFCKGSPSKPRTPIISVTTTDEDVAYRVGALLGTKPWHQKPRKQHWKYSWVIHLRGQRAVDLMKDLRPLMGERRKQAIDLAIASGEGVKRRLPDSTKEKIVEEYRQGGVSFRRLAVKYQVSHQAVSNYVKHAGVEELESSQSCQD